MKIRIWFLLPLTVFIFLFIFFKIGLGKDPNLLPSLLVNKVVPVFSAPSLDNLGQITNTRFKGQITILNIWATWCVTCRIEHPILMDLSKWHQIKVYGVNYKDDRNEAIAYLSKMGNPYHEIIYDPLGDLAVQFGVYGTPESFLIDKKGVVRYRYVGPLTLDVLEKDLLPRIKQIEAEGK